MRTVVCALVLVVAAALRAPVPAPPRAGAVLRAALQIPVASLQSQWRVIPDIWDSLARLAPDQTMLVDVTREPAVKITYAEAQRTITTIAAALQKLGLLMGDCISLFSENSPRWLLVEQGVMKAGGCNAVRGVAAPIAELRYIYDNSGSMGLVVETSDLLVRLYEASGLKSQSGSPKFIVVLYSEGRSGETLRSMVPGLSSDTFVATFEELVASATPAEYRGIVKDAEASAAIVYTSGTTSKPKGVTLRHKNILHQVTSSSFSRNLRSEANPRVADVFLSILPCWHIFERTAEYYFLSRGCTMVYSNLRSFKSDLQLWRPHFLVVVPRLVETIQKGVLQNFRKQSPGKRRLAALVQRVSSAFRRRAAQWSDALVQGRTSLPLRLLAGLLAALLWPLHTLGDLLVWSKVRASLGGRLKVIVSGGSLLPLSVERFFDMAGLRVIVGYGLTETAPTITSRYVEHNVIGTVGSPTPQTSIRIVDPGSEEEVEDGAIGLLLARGPSVMAGYVRNEAATKEAIRGDGYFRTGDLGRRIHTGDIVITGRLKDVIVLSNGENVEPEPIEQALLGLALVDQAMVLGQDRRFLSALLVLNVGELVSRGFLSRDRGAELSTVIGATPLLALAGDDACLRREEQALADNAELLRVVRAAVEEATRALQPWERIYSFQILLTPFSVSNGMLTQTLKIKRDAVVEAYSGAIDALYSKSADRTGASVARVSKS